FNGIAIRVFGPCLTGMIHTRRNLRDRYTTLSQPPAEILQPGDLQAEMPVACAVDQFFDASTPDLGCHSLIEEFQEGSIPTGKVIPKRLAILIIQCEFDGHAEFVHIEIDDGFQVIGNEIDMGQFSDHETSLSDSRTISLTRPTAPPSRLPLIPC